MLATEVEVSDDNMTFTYTIRDDIVWSDGVPLTAEDVAYTMNLYKDNNAYLPQNYLTLLDGDVELIDPTHVQFRTQEPTALYSGEAPYMYFYILPKHIFEQVEAGNCPTVRTRARRSTTTTCRTSPAGRSSSRSTRSASSSG